MIKVLLLIAGGAIGSALRYGVSMWVQRTLLYSFPFGVLSVNLIGSFLIGFCWSLAEAFNFQPTQGYFFLPDYSADLQLSPLLLWTRCR